MTEEKSHPAYCPSDNPNFGCLVNEVARLLRKFFDRRARALGVTRSQWSVLFQLGRQEGQTQSELADNLDMEQPSLVRILDALEEARLVQRRPDAHDRRIKRVFLAEESHTILEPLGKVAEKTVADVLSPLDAAEQAQLTALLSKVKLNLLELRSQQAEEMETTV